MAGLLALSTAGVQAATVFCPNGLGGALLEPVSGRYIGVTNAAHPGTCYHQSGNLQNSDFQAVATAAFVAPANFLLLDKNGTDGIARGAITSIPGGRTGGDWSLTSNLWTSYSSLYLGFHFGNGGGDPDSFVVQLENTKLIGTWSFRAIDPDKVNGLSNYYLFGVSNGNGTPPPNRIPEPGSLALVGAALLAAGVLRRRFAN